jgi:hypothetical protein
VSDRTEDRDRNENVRPTSAFPNDGDGQFGDAYDEDEVREVADEAGVDNAINNSRVD